MARITDSSWALSDRAGALARRVLALAAVAVGLVFGLAAGLLGLVAGGDPEIVPTCLLAGAGLGWLLARAVIAFRLRLMRMIGVWLLGRLVPGSRTVKAVTAVAAVSRAGALRR